MADDQTTRIDALAALAVEVSANVADGQTVIVRAHLVDAPLVRAIVRAAYRRGAQQVEVDWNDPLVRKIRLEEAGDAALGWVSPWVHELPTKLGEVRGSMIMLAGDPAPGLYDDIDAGRVGRDTVPVPEWGAVVARAGRQLGDRARADPRVGRLGLPGPRRRRGT